MSKFVYTDDDLLEIEEPVSKHGTHDQKTHGSWATGTTPNTIESSTNNKGVTTYDVTYGDINLKIDG